MIGAKKGDREVISCSLSTDLFHVLLIRVILCQFICILASISGFLCRIVLLLLWSAEWISSGAKRKTRIKILFTEFILLFPCLWLATSSLVALLFLLLLSPLHNCNSPVKVIESFVTIPTCKECGKWSDRYSRVSAVLLSFSSRTGLSAIAICGD